MNVTAKTNNGTRNTAVSSRFSSLLTAHSALFTSSSPLFPLFPASGPATSSFNGLHPKSKFLAIIDIAFNAVLLVHSTNAASYVVCFFVSRLSNRGERFVSIRLW